MLMAPPPVPSLIVRAACPPRELPAAPGLAQAPVTPPVPDRETKPGLGVAAVTAALAPALAILLALVPVVAVAAPVEAINRAPDPVTLTVLAAAINPAVVGTNSRFGDE
jgi:hypothetical protein